MKMNHISFEENINAFWSLFDKVFDRENITMISFEDHHGLMCGEISSVIKDEFDEPLESTLEIILEDYEELYKFMVCLIVGDVSYSTDYYTQSKVLSKKLGDSLWRVVRKQLYNNSRKSREERENANKD